MVLRPSVGTARCRLGLWVAGDKAVSRRLASQPAVTFSGIPFRTKEPRSGREDNQGTHARRGIQNKPELDGRSRVAGVRGQVSWFGFQV